MNVRESRLPNGVRVITAALPHVESATLGIWAGVGSRAEAPAEAGISHFIEHLLFKGTRRRSARQISQTIEGRGGYLNAFTGEEMTCYYARVAFDQMPRAMDVLGDMYLNARFDPADIAKERGVIIEEIMMYRDQPQHVVQEMLGQAMWVEHELGRPIIGSPETLGALTQREILAYRDRMYAPGRTVVALAGRVEHDACVALVERHLGGLGARPGPAPRPVTARTRQRRAAYATRKIEQTHLALGVRLFGQRDERRYPLRVLNAVLGENMSSRLFQIIRERHGLAYAVHSGVQLFRDSGALVISAGLDRKRYRRALELAVAELIRLKREPVPARELNRAKDYVVGQMRLALESTTHQMMWVGENLLSHDRFIPPEDVIARINAVDAEQVRELARQVFDPARISTALVCPESDGADDAMILPVLDRL